MAPSQGDGEPQQALGYTCFDADQCPPSGLLQCPRRLLLLLAKGPGLPEQRRTELVQPVCFLGDELWDGRPGGTGSQTLAAFHSP